MGWDGEWTHLDTTASYRQRLTSLVLACAAVLAYVLLVTAPTMKVCYLLYLLWEQNIQRTVGMDVYKSALCASTCPGHIGMSLKGVLSWALGPRDIGLLDPSLAKHWYPMRVEDNFMSRIVTLQGHFAMLSRLLTQCHTQRLHLSVQSPLGYLHSG